MCEEDEEEQLEASIEVKKVKLKANIRRTRKVYRFDFNTHTAYIAFFGVLPKDVGLKRIKGLLYDELKSHELKNLIYDSHVELNNKEIKKLLKEIQPFNLGEISFDGFHQDYMSPTNSSLSREMRANDLYLLSVEEKWIT